MELVGIMPVQLVQDLDDVGIGIGPAEGVSSAIEAENKLVRLLGLFSIGGNHSRGEGNGRVGWDLPTSSCSLYIRRYYGVLRRAFS